MTIVRGRGTATTRGDGGGPAASRGAGLIDLFGGGAAGGPGEFYAEKGIRSCRFRLEVLFDQRRRQMGRPRQFHGRDPNANPNPNPNTNPNPTRSYEPGRQS